MVHAGLTLETCVERTATVGRVATRRGQSGNPSILVIVKDEAGWLSRRLTGPGLLCAVAHRGARRRQQLSRLHGSTTDQANRKTPRRVVAPAHLSLCDDHSDSMVPGCLPGRAGQQNGTASLAGGGAGFLNPT